MSVHSESIIFYLQTACNAHSNDLVGKATSTTLSNSVLKEYPFLYATSLTLFILLLLSCYAAKCAKEFSICYVSFPYLG